MKAEIRVALTGNPNTGKSTLFNALTGLNQKVGNFPGVTVDKKTGYCELPDGRTAEIIDLPGTYSLYPKSRDESIVFSVLADKASTLSPDLVVVVLDASNLKRNLLLYTQIADLKIPVIVALNMMDVARKNEIKIDVDGLAAKLGVPVVPISARKMDGITELKQAISFANKFALQTSSIDVEALAPQLIAAIGDEMEVDNPYFALQLAHQHETLTFLSPEQSDRIEELEHVHSFHSQKAQAQETIARYSFINDILYDTVTTKPVTAHEETLSNRIDKVLTHKIFGFVIFLGILMFMFQAIFAWSAYPMELIGDGFAWLQGALHQWLPAGPVVNLLADGIVAGLSGVMVFIPQIAILFGFISILEDTGYMARVTFMMDRIMRKVGLNGKSVVPLIGGFACAVPSIMSTRTIENWKDRMITIMVTPLITCSARLPIYTLMIALVVPSRTVWGIFSLQGLALTGMYIFSLLSAVIVAFVMKFLIRSRERGYFIMELPVYRMPRWKNVFLTMYERAKTFVIQAGKVIVAVSVILWVLASYGPGNRFEKIDQKYSAAQYKNVNADDLRHAIASEKLENSYAGVLGHTIEPVIRPLGFDWKIGIALITSFAAREVFVGTMATIYSVDGDAEKIESVQQKMGNAKNPQTGQPVFTVAVAFSLMMFYAFAMQCASTMAVVYRETKSWRWPAAQFAYMTGLAYIVSLITYTLLR